MKFLKRMRKEHGAITVIVAVSMVVLLGMSAVALDYGNMVNDRRELQAAFDAAALAGAIDLPDTLTAAQTAKQ